MPYRYFFSDTPTNGLKHQGICWTWSLVHGRGGREPSFSSIFITHPFKLVWRESTSPCNSLIGYSLKWRCCLLVWPKSFRQNPVRPTRVVIKSPPRLRALYSVMYSTYHIFHVHWCMLFGHISNIYFYICSRRYFKTCTGAAAEAGQLGTSEFLVDTARSRLTCLRQCSKNYSFFSDLFTKQIFLQHKAYSVKLW